MWLPPNLASELTDFYGEAESLQFSLYVDGSRILKPVLFKPPGNRALISRFEYDGEHVGAKGYFYAQASTVRPQDLQGLLIRIRNAAIGEYDHDFLGYSPTESSLIQRWISAEIWADDRLEEAMNIDRRTLRVAHPAYVELQRAVHSHLSQVLRRARAELYGEKSKARNQERARTIVGSINQATDEMVAPDAPAVAEEIKRSWTRTAQEDRGEARILKRFTVADLYRITLEIAEEILTPEQRQEFVRRLTARLRK
jgi:isoleucyl-tRNA synthetase